MRRFDWDGATLTRTWFHPIEAGFTDPRPGRLGTGSGTTPAFDGDATTENSIVVSGRTMILEQNLPGGRGVARFDLKDDGTCTRVWLADVHAPSCVPTLSRATSLVYVYTHENRLWGLTALDLETGDTVFTVPTGHDASFDNFYSAITIGPEGRIFVGVLSGIVSFEESR